MTKPAPDPTPNPTAKPTAIPATDLAHDRRWSHVVTDWCGTRGNNGDSAQASASPARAHVFDQSKEAA